MAMASLVMGLRLIRTDAQFLNILVLQSIPNCLQPISASHITRDFQVSQQVTRFPWSCFERQVHEPCELRIFVDVIQYRRRQSFAHPLRLLGHRATERLELHFWHPDAPHRILRSVRVTP